MFIKNWLKSPIFYGISYLILYIVIGLILYKLDYMYLQGFRVFSILLIATLLIAGLVLYIKNKEGSTLDQVFMLIILVIITVIFLIVEALFPRERIVTVGNEKQVEITSNTFLKENVNYYQYVNIFVRGNKIKVNEVEKQYNNTETIIDDDTTDILYEQRFSDTNIIRLRLIDYISSKNIVSSIQSEQNEVIRKDLTDNIIVQGVAGSGKTTVALHRIAYLAYNYRNKIKSNQYMIIGPNKFFIKYTSSVLPDLDVTDVPQLTYEEFTKEYLKEDFSLVKEKISDTEFNANKFKMSLDYKTVIDNYIAYLEKEKVLPLKDFCIKDFNILPKEVIRDIYDNIDDKYISNIEAKIERTILMASTYLKNNQGKVITALMAKYNKLLDNAKDNKSKTTINNTYDKIKKELESSGLSSSLRKYFTFRSKKTTALYSDMIKDIEKYCDNKDVKEIKDNEPKEKNTLAFEDLPGLIYLHYRLHGSGIYKDYRQTVIDEAQDYGTFNFYALKQVLSSSSFSIFGDLAQSIYDYRSIDNWNDVISESFDNDCKLEYLLKSYRTTMEIMNSANLVLSYIGLKTATPVIRHGEDVRYLKIKENDYNTILERVNLLKEKDYQSIALISRNSDEAIEMADNLAKLGLDIKNISEDNADYDSGICSLSSELSKGLEFDAVIN